MTRRRNFPALCAAVAAVGLGGGVVQADQSGQADLQRQIEQLQRQVQELQARVAQQPAGPAFTAKDVDAAVDSVLRDADRRSQLLAESGGFFGGWRDGAFRIRSADDNYELQPFAQFQFRSVTNMRQDDEVDGDDAWDDGFEVRRMKFGIKGHAVTPKLKYEFRWATDRSNGQLLLENAFVTYNFADGWSVKGGQWKDNVWREETTSSGRQLAVDRSFLNESLGGGETDYVQGVSLLYDSAALRAELAYIDGANSDNTNFQDDDSNFGVSGRVEFKVAGDWKAYDDFSAMNNKGKNLLVFGAGADWTQTGDTDLIYHTADVQFETGPLGLFAAYVGRYTMSDDAGADDVLDWGLLAQAGFMLNDRWELFGRYDITLFDADQANGEDTVHEITGGVNYYLKGHAAKFTVDATWLPAGSPESHSGIGIVGQGTDDNQFLIRAQFQLLL